MCDVSVFKTSEEDQNEVPILSNQKHTRVSSSIPRSLSRFLFLISVKTENP